MLNKCTLLKKSVVYATLLRIFLLHLYEKFLLHVSNILYIFDIYFT